MDGCVSGKRGIYAILGRQWWCYDWYDNTWYLINCVCWKDSAAQHNRIWKEVNGLHTNTCASLSRRYTQKTKQGNTHNASLSYHRDRALWTYWGFIKKSVPGRIIPSTPWEQRHRLSPRCRSRRHTTARRAAVRRNNIQDPTSRACFLLPHMPRC